MMNKIKKNMSIIILLLLGIVASLTLKSDSPQILVSKKFKPEFKDQLSNFVYLVSEVSLFDRSLPESSASGFIFSSNESHVFIITAHHFCQDNEISPEIAIAKRTIYAINSKYPREAHVISYDEKNDICILTAVKYSWETFKDVKFAESMPRIGEDVYNFAAPNGISSPNINLMFKGFFSGCEIDSCLYTIPATFGSSGSPVYNKKGELISIIVSASPEFENVAIGPDIYKIKKLIDDTNKIVRIK